MHRWGFALKELIGRTSERDALIGALAVKALCLYAPACEALTAVAGWFNSTPDMVVGGLLGYAAMRFRSKVNKAPAAPVKLP